MSLELLYTLVTGTYPMLKMDLWNVLHMKTIVMDLGGKSWTKAYRSVNVTCAFSGEDVFQTSLNI